VGDQLAGSLPTDDPQTAEKKADAIQKMIDLLQQEK
jgi:hypothetical protein